MYVHSRTYCDENAQNAAQADSKFEIQIAQNALLTESKFKIQIKLESKLKTRDLGNLAYELFVRQHNKHFSKKIHEHRTRYKHRNKVESTRNNERK